MHTFLDKAVSIVTVVRRSNVKGAGLSLVETEFEDNKEHLRTCEAPYFREHFQNL